VLDHLFQDTEIHAGFKYELLKLDYHTHSRNAFNNRVLRLVRNKYLVRDEIPYRTQGYVYSISD